MKNLEAFLFVFIASDQFFAVFGIGENPSRVASSLQQTVRIGILLFPMVPGIVRKLTTAVQLFWPFSANNTHFSLSVCRG